MSSLITAEATVCEAPSPWTARRATVDMFLASRRERSSKRKQSGGGQEMGWVWAWAADEQGLGGLGPYGPG